MLLLNKFLFLAVYGGLVWMPGYLASAIMGIRAYRFLSSVSFSLLLFLLLLSVARTLDLPVFTMALCWISITCLLWILSVSMRRHRTDESGPSIPKLFSATFEPRMALGIVVVTMAYFLWFGVYDELPADLYQHLAYTGDAYAALATGEIPGNLTDIFDVNLAQKDWYYLPAIAALVSGTGVFQVYPLVMVFSSVLLLLAAGLVADRLFQPFRLAPPLHRVAIISTVFFVAAQMGVNVFSYLRYYSMAPGMTNLVVYFCGLVALLDIVERRDRGVKVGVVLIVSLLVSLVLHMQEALFLLVAITLMAGWYAMKSLSGSGASAMSRGLAVVTLVSCCLLVAGGILLVRQRFDIHPFSHHKVLQLPFSLPFLERAYILDPGFQFFEVVTTWGVLVYLLFILNLKFLLRQPFLVLAMLSPLLTVFNPYFADVFMRTNNSTVLWRLCYFIPLHFVAAICLVRLVGVLGEGDRIRRAGSGLAILSLVALLFPATAGFRINPHARATLGAVAAENSHHHWDDLLAFLRTVPKGEAPVLTDPLTGYLVQALTDHDAYNYKFFSGIGYGDHPFVFPDYADQPLSRYPGRLLIVNQRDGAYSRIGELSNHWYPDVLEVSRHYPEALLAHLRVESSPHELLWSRDRVAVYRLASAGNSS